MNNECINYRPASEIIQITFMHIRFYILEVLPVLGFWVGVFFVVDFNLVIYSPADKVQVHNVKYILKKIYQIFLEKTKRSKIQPMCDCRCGTTRRETLSEP